jgi:hypothetical protein
MNLSQCDSNRWHYLIRVCRVTHMLYCSRFRCLYARIARLQTLLCAYCEVENTSVPQANAELGSSSGSMACSTNSQNYKLLVNLKPRYSSLYPCLEIGRSCVRFSARRSNMVEYFRCSRQSLQANIATITLLCKDSFLPDSFQFVIHKSFCVTLIKDT